MVSGYCSKRPANPNGTVTSEILGTLYDMLSLNIIQLTGGITLYNIFLSHSGKDEKLARRIKNKGESMGFNIYMYQDDIKPGKNLPYKLERQIRKSHAVIALITKNSIKSSTVQQEIGLAKGAKKWIIPMVQKDIEYDKLGFLQGLEYIVFDPNDNDIGMKSVNNYLEKLGNKIKSKNEVAATNENNNDDVINLGTVLAMIIFILGFAFITSEE